MRQILTIILLFAAFPFCGIARGVPPGSTNQPVVNTEYYANGNIKKVTRTRIHTPRNSDLFNYFKETRTICTEFDSISGRKLRQTTRITKVGPGGKHCHEIKSIVIDYDANGKRRRYEKSVCDKNKLKYKEYVDGKVTFIHIQKSRKRKG